MFLPIFNGETTAVKLFRWFPGFRTSPLSLGIFLQGKLGRSWGGFILTFLRWCKDSPLQTQWFVWQRGRKKTNNEFDWHTKYLWCYKCVCELCLSSQRNQFQELLIFSWGCWPLDGCISWFSPGTPHLLGSFLPNSNISATQAICQEQHLSFRSENLKTEKSSNLLNGLLVAFNKHTEKELENTKSRSLPFLVCFCKQLQFEGGMFMFWKVFGLSDCT